MTTVEKLLPDYCYSGRKIDKVDGLVIHHFSCMNVDPGNQFDIDACYNLMVDLNLPRSQREHYLKDDRCNEGRFYASAHAFIDRDGTLYQLINYGLKANHAGASMMADRHNCNEFTLGVELIGTSNSGFTEAQYDTLAEFCAEQMAEHDFDEEFIQGHDTVRNAAIQDGKKSARKYDPSGQWDGNGTNFDWNHLSALIELYEE